MKKYGIIIGFVTCVFSAWGQVESVKGWDLDSVIWRPFEDFGYERVFISHQQSHIDENALIGVTSDGLLARLHVDEVSLEVQELWSVQVPDLEVRQVEIVRDSSMFVLGINGSGEVVLGLNSADGGISMTYPTQALESELLEGGCFVNADSLVLFASSTVASDTLGLRKWVMDLGGVVSVEDLYVPRSCGSSTWGILPGDGTGILAEAGCNRTYVTDILTGQELSSGSAYQDEFLGVGKGFRDVNQNGKTEQLFMSQRPSNGYRRMWTFEKAYENGISDPHDSFGGYSGVGFEDPANVCDFAGEDGQTRRVAIFPSDSTLRVLQNGFSTFYGLGRVLPHQVEHDAALIPYPSFNEPRMLLCIDGLGLTGMRLNRTPKLPQRFSTSYGQEDDSYSSRGSQVELMCVNETLFRREIGDTAISRVFEGNVRFDEPRIHYDGAQGLFSLITQEGNYYQFNDSGVVTDTLGFTMPSHTYQMNLADLDGDQDPEMWFFRSDTLWMLKNVGGLFGEQFPLFPISQSGWTCHHSDLNGDGLMDFVWQDADSLRTALNQGDFQFSITAQELPGLALVRPHFDAVHEAYVVMKTRGGVAVFEWGEEGMVLSFEVSSWWRYDYDFEWRSYSSVNDEGEFQLLLGNSSSQQVLSKDGLVEPFDRYAHFVEDEILSADYYNVYFGPSLGNACNSPESLGNVDSLYPIGNSDGCNFNHLIGCTDSNACNYDETAMIDAGCHYGCGFGCKDAEACNYDSEAIFPDSTCEYGCYGCTVPEAMNFEPEAIYDDGSCLLDNPACPAQLNLSICPTANFDSTVVVCFGELEGMQDATVQIEGGLEAGADFAHLRILQNEGLVQEQTFTGAIQYSSTFEVNSETCIEIQFTTDASLQCSSGAFEPLSIVIGCELLEYKGCMEPSACNYNVSAMVAGPCRFPDACGNCYPLPPLDEVNEKRFLDRIVRLVEMPDSIEYCGGYDNPSILSQVQSAVPIHDNCLIWPGMDGHAVFQNLLTGEEETQLEFWFAGVQSLSSSSDSWFALIARELSTQYSDADEIWIGSMRYELGNPSIWVRHRESSMVWQFDFTWGCDYQWVAYPVFELKDRPFEVVGLERGLMESTMFAYEFGAASTAPIPTYSNSISFEKQDYAPVSSGFYDVWGDGFSIYRNNSQGLYNAAYCEQNYGDCSWYGNELTGSLWGAPGASFPGQFSDNWSTAVDLHPELNGSSQEVPGHEFWVYVESLDETWSVVFSSWTCCQSGGGFAYTRTLLGSGPPTSGSVLSFFNEAKEGLKTSSSNAPNSSEWLILSAADQIALTRGGSQGWYNPYVESQYAEGFVEGMLWGPANSTDLNEYHTSWKNMMCNVFNDCSYASNLEIHGIYLESSDRFYNLEYLDWACCGQGGNFHVIATPMGTESGVNIESCAVPVFGGGTAIKTSGSCSPPESEWLHIPGTSGLALTRGCNGGWYNPVVSSGDTYSGTVNGLKWGPANSTNLDEYEDGWRDMMCNIFNDCSYFCYLQQHGLYVEATGEFYNLIYDSWACGNSGGNYQVSLEGLSGAGTLESPLGCAAQAFISSNFDSLEVQVDTLDFFYSGEVQVVDIPVGVSFLAIQALGAPGGSSEEEYGGEIRPGGRGAFVEGVFYNPPNQVQIAVGKPGAGGTSYSSGDGGGASAVVGNGLPMLVAGGGGGAKAGYYPSGNVELFDASLEEHSLIPTVRPGNDYFGNRYTDGLGGAGTGYSAGAGWLTSGNSSQSLSSLFNGVEEDLPFGGGGKSSGSRPGGGGGYSGGNMTYGGSDSDYASGGGSFNDGWFQRFGHSSAEPFVRMYLVTVDTLRCGNGCLDPVACNYDGSSLEDDGSCEYASCAGCMDEEACNFNDEATIDDPEECDFITCAGCLDEGACNYDPAQTISAPDQCEYVSCAGCLDPEACNYDETAVLDAFDCIYPEPFRDCDGNCFSDFDSDGVCDEEEIPGCTYPGADNYNPLATEENGSCQFAGVTDVFGCTYDTACNYNPEATADDGSCIYPELGFDCNGDCLYDSDNDGICNEFEGCTNLLACNYDPLAIDNDGSCVFPPTGYDCLGNCLEDSDGDGVCDEFEFPGCTDPQACNYYPPATDDDGSCTYPLEGYDCDGNCVSDMDGDGVCDVNEVVGCQIEGACNYDPAVTDNDGSCWFPLPFEDCDGNCLLDFDGDGVCDENEILGCTYPDALNFSPQATDEDGSCVFEEDVDVPGCFYSTACNYQPEATVNDGSCIFPTLGYDCDGNCIVDTDGDGVCDIYEIRGCMDSEACNFDPEATDNEDCEYVTCAGCMELAACNYDPLATLPGFCDYTSCAGCMEEAACNYDALATLPSFCDYPAPGQDCDGNCLVDTDGDGVCDELPGCTDINALNYNPEATTEDGSCTYPCAQCLPVFDVMPMDSVVTCPEELPTGALDFTATNPCTGESLQVLGFVTESGSDLCSEFITLTYIALNPACGNFSEVSHTFSVLDEESPEILSAPTALVQPCDSELELGEVLFVEDCREVVVTFDLDTIPVDCAVDGAMHRYERTVTGVDACGNATSVSYFIDLMDEVPPSLSILSSSVEVSCADQLPQPEFDVDDNCGNVVLDTTLMWIEANEAQWVCPVVERAQWLISATDECGNVSMDSVQIAVIDTTPPVLLDIPEDISLACGEELPLLELPVAEDACSGLTDVQTWTESVPGECPNESTVTQHYAAEDGCGNEVFAARVISIVDEEPPVFDDIPVVISGVYCEDFESLELEVMEWPIASDACGSANVSFESIWSCGGNEDGQVIRLYTAVDACGNEAQQLQLLQIVDWDDCAGCTDPSAINYSEFAWVEDYSCEYDVVTGCTGDLDGNGAVGTPDLLELLASFGTGCE